MEWMTAIGATVDTSCGVHITVGVQSVIGSSEAGKVSEFVRKLAHIAQWHAMSLYGQTGTGRHLSRYSHTLAADVELARSESDGSVPFGDHDFRRVAARVQLAGEGSQTDFFAGWQEKFFGWPNLYTPFGFNETEYLETELFAFNHRAWTTPQNYWQVGAYYRRNYDDYEFNRAVPGASNPFIHTTHVRAVAADETAAELLSVPVGAPLLSVERVSYTYGDRPVEVRRGLYVTTKHYYQNDLS